MPLILSGKEIKKLFKSINTDKIYGVRNRALYGLIYSAGLRVSEAVLLNTCDLFLFRNIAKVLGKGNRERFVIFDDITAYWLNEYLKRIRPLFLKDTKENALFLNKNGKRLTKTCIWKNYSQLAKKTNVSSTKLHTLRHTFATELLKGGASIRTIQMLLGHVNINTTQIYTHLNTKDLRYNHIKYMPKLFKQRQI
jgi:integrase/recombinase XerD